MGKSSNFVVISLFMNSSKSKFIWTTISTSQKIKIIHPQWHSFHLLCWLYSDYGLNIATNVFSENINFQKVICFGIWQAIRWSNSFVIVGYLPASVCITIFCHLQYSVNSIWITKIHCTFIQYRAIRNTQEKCNVTSKNLFKKNSGKVQDKRWC